MSLEALRALRREGVKPDVVSVLVGRRIPAVESRPDLISITARDRSIDWRAVVGLPVVLFVCDDASDLGEQVYDAVKAASGKVLAVVWSDYEVAPEEARKPLRRTWSALCRS